MFCFRKFRHLLLLSLFCVGCVPMSMGPPLDGEERLQVVTGLKKMFVEQGACPASFDADARVRVEKYGQGGGLSGYLRGQSPGLLRFEGVNPLGMTELLAGVSDQEWFFLKVRQQHVTVGKLDSTQIREYVKDPSALRSSYYLIIGRLPPGSVMLGPMWNSNSGEGYWLETVSGDERGRNRLLVDLVTGTIKEHILMDEAGRKQIHFQYQYDLLGLREGEEAPDSSSCSLPSQVIIEGTGLGTVTLSLKNMNFDTHFTAADFKPIRPQGFLLERIQ